MIKLTSSKKELTYSNPLRLFLFTGIAFFLGSLHLSAVDVRCPPPEKVKCGAQASGFDTNCKATTHLKKSKFPEMDIHWEGTSVSPDYQPRKLDKAEIWNWGPTCLYDQAKFHDEVSLSMELASERKFTHCEVDPQGMGFKCH